MENRLPATIRVWKTGLPPPPVYGKQVTRYHQSMEKRVSLHHQYGKQVSLYHQSMKNSLKSPPPE
jgi:hypothetical protein